MLDEQVAWAVWFGFELAMWLGVPHVDHRGRVTTTTTAAIASACHEVAMKVETLPASGTFDHLHHTIGAFEGHGGLRLRVAPKSAPEQRFLELRVSTPSDRSSMGSWIKQGTNRDIAAFLRDHRTPRTIVLMMRELAKDLKDQDYA